MIYALALGFFQQAVLPFGKPVQALGLGLLLTSFFYLLIPICLSAYEAQSFALLCVLMSIDGYFQSFAWPNLLMLVNSQFDNKKEAIKLGIWSTNTNVGNIMGFVICQYLVLNTGLPWEISMVFISLFLIVNSILIFIFIKELPKTDTP
jgi:sugar phosphate permease